MTQGQSDHSPLDGGHSAPDEQATEFSRMVKDRSLPAEPVVLAADAQERADLAKRFGLEKIDQLRAEVALSQSGKAIRAEGKLLSEFIQLCAVSGEELNQKVDEPLALRFVPASRPTGDTGEEMPADLEGEIQIELDAQELDEIEYEGGSFDLGEAIAQSLGLVIDPYAKGPNADAIRSKVGIASDDAPKGPLAEALAALQQPGEDKPSGNPSGKAG